MASKTWIAGLMLLALACPLALAEPSAPTWDEFCPIKYRNAAERQRNAFIGYFAGSDWQSYWARRRVAFQNSVALCDAVEDKAGCYMKIREDERQESNQMRMAVVGAQAQANQRRAAYQSSQTNQQLQQVNQNLNGLRYGY